MKLDPLKGRRVLVTGAGGFIGSHLVELLLEAGCDVRAFVHYNALGKRGWLDEIEAAKSLDVHAGDIADPGSVRTAAEGREIIFHLAALIGIPYSYVAPNSYVRTNIDGTLNVLNAARETGARVVHTSTSEVYGTAREVPISESHPLQGQSPYSASKIGADKLAESYHLSFELPVVTVRPFNTFGPRQSARAVIPTIISQCLAGKSEIKLGSLSPTRDMNYVSNTAEGFALAGLSEDAVGHTINLGSGREISIGDLAALIAELCGVEVEITTDEQRIRPEGSEVNRLLADSRLAKELLGWTPRRSLEEGLTETIRWMRDAMEHYRPDEYTT